ncbi:hypothetical protein FOL46_009292 [Perkinsus olseni]|uniref:Uncharacterized protein n=1 Tax=Perkinsus olseni TaxID=32597 RepID=A0A7J6ML36_PEROL|nr:hypothetical protein FOL46_009292 [Perkinsus olseni]
MTVPFSAPPERAFGRFDNNDHKVVHDYPEIISAAPGRVEQPDLEYAGLYKSQQPLKESRRSRHLGRVATAAVALLSLYTFLDANKAVMVYWSYSARSPEERYSAGSLVLAENILSLVASVGISFACLGPSQCRSMWSTQYFFRLVPSALCFTLARILGMRALQYIDAGTLKVMSQAALPTNAVLSSLLMGTKSVVGTTRFGELSPVFVFLATDVSPSWTSKTPPATLLFTSLGAVYSEKCIKAGGNAPFYHQKAMLSLASCLCVGLLLGMAPVIDGDATRKLDHLFDHWDGRTVVALVSWTLSSWTAGIVVKRLSVVLKNVAQCVAILITYFATNIFLLNEIPSFATVLLACAVLQSSVMYDASCAYWSVQLSRLVSSIHMEDSPTMCIIHLKTQQTRPTLWWTSHRPEEGVVSGHAGCLHDGPRWPECSRSEDVIASHVSPLLIDASRFDIGMSPQCRNGDCTLTDTMPTTTVQLCAAICHFSLACTLWVFDSSTELCNLFRNTSQGEFHIDNKTYGDPHCYQARFVYSSHYADHLDASLSCWAEDFMLPEVCCSVRNHYRGYYACWEHFGLANNVEQHRTFERCCMAVDSTRRFRNLGDAVETFAFDHRGEWIQRDSTRTGPYL